MIKEQEEIDAQRMALADDIIKPLKTDTTPGRAIEIAKGWIVTAMQETANAAFYRDYAEKLKELVNAERAVRIRETEKAEKAEKAMTVMREALELYAKDESWLPTQRWSGVPEHPIYDPCAATPDVARRALDKVPRITSNVVSRIVTSN